VYFDLLIWVGDANSLLFQIVDCSHCECMAIADSKYNDAIIYCSVTSNITLKVVMGNLRNSFITSFSLTMRWPFANELVSNTINC